MLLLNAVNINFNEETNTEQKVEILEDLFISKTNRYSFQDLSIKINKENKLYFQTSSYFLSLYSSELHFPPPEFIS